MNIFYYETIIGTIGITEENGYIIQLDKVNNSINLLNEKHTETILLKETAKQLKEYLRGERREFCDLPINPQGTPFQKKVWERLLAIPYGETRSYGEIAKEVGNPKASRAIGMANHRNPIMILIPCHRVIGSSGKLVGYAGGLDVKIKFLELEGIEFAP